MFSVYRCYERSLAQIAVTESHGFGFGGATDNVVSVPNPPKVRQPDSAWRLLCTCGFTLGAFAHQLQIQCHNPRPSRSEIGQAFIRSGPLLGPSVPRGGYFLHGVIPFLAQEGQRAARNVPHFNGCIWEFVKFMYCFPSANTIWKQEGDLCTLSKPCQQHSHVFLVHVHGNPRHSSVGDSIASHQHWMIRICVSEPRFL